MALLSLPRMLRHMDVYKEEIRLLEKQWGNLKRDEDRKNDFYKNYGKKIFDAIDNIILCNIICEEIFEDLRCGISDSYYFHFLDERSL